MSIQQQQGDEERRRQEEDMILCDSCGEPACAGQPSYCIPHGYCVEASNNYADAMIRRDLLNPPYDTRGETAPDGRNIADTNRQISKDFAVIESISNRQKRKP